VLARAIRGLGAAVGALPVPVALALGRGLGTVAYAFMAGPRALAIAHMGLAFPDLDRTARARLARETFRHAGQSFVELALWTKLTRRPGYVAVEGDEAIRAALAEGRGCIAVAGHLGNWELLAATMAARGWPITVVARQVNDLRFHRLIYDFRTAAGVEVLLRDDASFLSAVRGALRRGRIVALLIDQDTRGAGVFVPFFGRPARTPPGAALLALRARVPVLTAFIERRRDGGHLIRVAPLDVPPGNGRGRVIELTARMTAAIEAQIRRAPAEWVWWHERWRRRPPENQLYTPPTAW